MVTCRCLPLVLSKSQPNTWTSLASAIVGVHIGDPMHPVVIVAREPLQHSLSLIPQLVEGKVEIRPFSQVSSAFPQS